MIAKAALWLLCLYLTLKLTQLVFGGRGGFGDGEITLRQKLLRGEPILFAVAFAIAVPAAVWSSWFVQTGYTSAFAHATDCYGRLRAIDHLAGMQPRPDPMQVYHVVIGAQGASFLSARSLDLEPAVVNKTLADRMDFYTNRYSTLSGAGDRQQLGAELGAIERCLTNLRLNCEVGVECSSDKRFRIGRRQCAQPRGGAPEANTRINGCSVTHPEVS